MTELGRVLKKKRPSAQLPAAKKNENSILELNPVNDFIFELENEERPNEATKNHSERGILSRGLIHERGSSLPENFSFPRLPSSDADVAYFHDWRKRISQYQDKEAVQISPFERNIEVWKHLMFVMHKCDVLIQVLDARNPLFYWIDDIPEYLRKMDDKKTCLALLNKSDLLSQPQMDAWSDYFASRKIPILFYSATSANFGTFELIPEVAKVCKRPDIESIGFIGFPNVGKSSTINRILGRQKVATGPMPGKTKHTQSFIVSDTMIFDCPGLVFPKICSKNDLVLNGVIPLDSLKDYLSPIRRLFDICPLSVLESYYGISMLNEESLRSWGIDIRDQPLSFLYSVSNFRKFFTSNHGVPDITRSSKLILKDYVSGKLGVSIPPPIPGSSTSYYDDYKLESSPYESIYIPTEFTIKK